ncbi:MAG: helicase-related protein, partial [Pseudomonadota bacterium]
MSALSPIPHAANGGALTAVLGPTNTGKTYFAIERLLSHPSGMIGLPLRLLAREVYDKLVARRGARDVALVTGEEKIIPRDARYWVCTVEAMPLEREVAFVAIDEIQLAADLERGRVFTSRLLHARGRNETLFLGSETMRPILRRLFPDIQFVARERLSVLTYAGPKKVTRLPRRSAVVAFSADTVYAVAELIRRQRGGAAVVLGALSPRTRNAQAELYQSGEVDYLVATDAIGMGLNMDIDHVAFAARRKFDGRSARDLRNDELAQIAGRAGRHLRDGTFGVTADCHGFDEEIIAAIENHQFDPASSLQWRSEALDFSSLPGLMNALAAAPAREGLARARPGDDEIVLGSLARRADIRERAGGGAALRLLWDVCQIPDFRKIAIDEHASLLGEIYEQLIDDGRVSDAWLAPRVDRLDRTDGDIDALSNRIAHVRTWTYLSNRAAWLEKAGYWQEKTRRIEDRLSDALHDKLTQRFVDRRTSVLFKKLKDDAPILAGVTDDGDVIVEGQFVGRLMGFEFQIDPRAKGIEAKRVRAAAEKALAPVLAARAAALANAKPEELSITDDAVVRWRSSAVARFEKGPAPLRPSLSILGLEALSPSLRGRIQDRLQDYVAGRIEGLLGPLIVLGQAAEAGEGGELNAVARGVAYRLVENFGAMSRVHFGDELKKLEQEERAKMRRLGMRFGEYTLFVPALLKPAPAGLLTMLWSLWTGRKPADFQPPKAGLVSLPVIEDLPHAYYYASGFRPSGARAVRIDMLERLAGQIRSDRKDKNFRDGFEATSQMMSLVGCSGEDFEGILKSLGYKMERKTVPIEPAAPEAEVAKETETETETK